jgi:hypothetical protein
LYEENEDKMEDPRKKKKDVWKQITQQLNSAGYDFPQTKVEGKWRSLLASHKALRDNKTKTGQKRKSFQHFERMDTILSKRHDVNPMFTSGSDVQLNATTSSENVQDSPNTHTNASHSDSEMSSECCPESKKNLSASASRRREKRKLEKSESSSKLLDLIVEMEKQRKTEREEREKKRDERAKEKNDLLRQFLEVMKNK